MFNPLTLEPHRAYYAFVAFHELRKLGTAVEVRTEGAENRVWAAAAAKDCRRALMVANMDDAAEPLLLDAWPGATCRITDATRTYEPCGLPAELPPESILLIC